MRGCSFCVNRADNLRVTALRGVAPSGKAEQRLSAGRVAIPRLREESFRSADTKRKERKKTRESFRRRRKRRRKQKRKKRTCLKRLRLPNLRVKPSIRKSFCCLQRFSHPALLPVAAHFMATFSLAALAGLVKISVLRKPRV